MRITKKAVSLVLAMLMVTSLMSVMAFSVNAAEWTFKLNSNFSGGGDNWAMVDITPGEDVPITLSEGHYQFEIVAYEDGNFSSYRGNSQAGEQTDNYSATMCTDGGHALFYATGGKYVLNYNSGTGLLTIAPHVHTWDTSNITWTATFDGWDATLTAHVPCTGCDDVEDFEGEVGMFGVEEAGYSNCSEEAYDTVSGYVTIGGVDYTSGPIVANTYPVDPENHPYDLEEHAAVESCTEAGHEAYYYCGACEKYFTSAEGLEEDLIADLDTWLAPGGDGYVAPLGHNKTHVAAQAATFDAPGNIEYWYCDRCEKYFSNEACTNEITQAQTVIAQKVAAAQVGDTKYETVAQAISAAQASAGNTVKLLNDCNTKVTCSYLNNSITIDLNGYTMSNSNSSSNYYNTCAIDINNCNKTVTIIDSSEGKTGSIVSDYGKAIFVRNSSKTELRDVTVTAGVAAAYVENNSSLVIDGGNYSTTTTRNTVIDVYNSTAKIYDGNFNSYDWCNVYSKNSDVKIYGGTYTAQSYEENNGHVYTDGASTSSLKISGGLFHQNVKRYCDDGFECVATETPDMYTVKANNPLNPMNVVASAIDDGNAFGIKTDYLMGTLIGVQKKTVAGQGTSTQEGTNNMRFIACLDTDILQSAEDYGFVVAKVDDTKDYSNTNIDALVANWGNGEKTVSAKDTYNNVCGTPAYGDPTDSLGHTDYKYITCAINNVSSSDKFVARFYVKTGGKTYYAKYSGHDYKYTGCIAAWSDLG